MKWKAIMKIVNKYVHITYKLNEKDPTIRIVIYKLGISINFFWI